MRGSAEEKGLDTLLTCNGIVQLSLLNRQTGNAFRSRLIVLHDKLDTTAIVCVRLACVHKERLDGTHLLLPSLGEVKDDDFVEIDGGFVFEEGTTHGDVFQGTTNIVLRSTFDVVKTVATTSVLKKNIDTNKARNTLVLGKRLEL